jgi:hypothetical protein
VIEFKRQVYQQALLELARLVFRDPISRNCPPDWLLQAAEMVLPEGVSEPAAASVPALTLRKTAP